MPPASVSTTVGRRAASIGSVTLSSWRRSGLAGRRAAMRWIIAAFYTAAGAAHLTVPEKLLLITPSWVPFAPWHYRAAAGSRLSRPLCFFRMQSPETNKSPATLVAE
jgi:hypothetical protein